MMPMPVRRKSRRMEKVENLYRTARVQNDFVKHIKTTQITLARCVARALAALPRIEYPRRGNAGPAIHFFRHGRAWPSETTAASAPPMSRPPGQAGEAMGDAWRLGAIGPIGL